MELDDNSLELVERRLSESVEKQVRDRLFRSYRVIWAAAFGVLAFFGYNVISGLNDRADKIALDAVRPAIEKANDAAAQVEDQLHLLLARLDAAEEFQRRREEKLIDSEHELSQNQVRVESIAKETDGRLGDIVRKLGETEAQLTAIGARTSEVAGIGNVSDLAADLQRVVERVETMTQDLLALQEQFGEEAEIRAYQPLDLVTAPSAALPPLLPPSVLPSDSVGLSPPSVAPQAPPRPPIVSPAAAAVAASGTVYLQFAGVDRDVAVGLSAELADLGYNMPGEERTPAAAGQHEVRYFFASDSARAGRLVGDINRILVTNGFRPDVILNDSINYSGGKPREGTLELWLEPMPAG